MVGISDDSRCAGSVSLVLCREFAYFRVKGVILVGMVGAIAAIGAVRIVGAGGLGLCHLVFWECAKRSSKVEEGGNRPHATGRGIVAVS